MSRLDFAVDREVQLGDWRIPDGMIALTRTYQIAASLPEQAQEFRRALTKHGLVGSMSAPANPYDNAQAESFMKTLEVEEVYLAGYETFEDVAARLPRFIEDVYNAKRMHSSIGYQSPNVFEAKRALQAA